MNRPDTNRSPGRHTPSVWAEARQKSHLLVQHMLCSMILGLQLATLPWVHAFHYISQSDGASVLTPRLAESRPGYFSQEDASRGAQASFAIRCRQLAANVVNTIKKHGRSILAVYSLGSLIEQHPDLLRLCKAAAARQRRPDLNHSAQVEDSSHATASQVYHAALADDPALDDILAGFVSRSETVVAEPGSRRVSTGSCRECQRSPSTRKQKTSIQTTPERMLSVSRLPLRVAPEGGASLPSILHSSRAGSSVQGTAPVIVDPHAHDHQAADRRHSLASSPTVSVQSTGTVIQNWAESLPPRRISAPSPIVGCPKEMERQIDAISRTSSTRTAECQSQHREGQIARKTSVPSVQTMTPTRGKRLQKRARTPRT
jgi:hypothetical protein